MNALLQQDLAGMASQAFIVRRLDMMMGPVALVAVHTRHGDLVGKGCLG